MKVFKVLSYCLVIFSLLLLTASCSPEGVIKKATDGAVEVDKDGNIEVKGEDGEMKIGEAKWDKSKMHGMAAPKANLESYVSTKDGTQYTFSGMKEKDTKAYIDKIKKAGFKYNIVSVIGSQFTGTNKDGLIISFAYSEDSDGLYSGFVASGKGEKPTDKNESTMVGGEDTEWDSSKVGGVPDPGVAITFFTSTNEAVTYNFEPMKNPKEYTEKIKECGFTIEPTEIESSEGFVYSASNSAGDQIYFSAQNDGCIIIFTKAT